MSSPGISEDDTYLIGNCSSQIIGNRLPTNKQALQLLFFNTRVLDKSKKDSENLAIKEITIFWNKASIPTQKFDRCRDKLDKLYLEYRQVQKHKLFEENFIIKLNKLFDIGHGNVLKQINEEQKAFLLDQRSDFPKKYIGNVVPKTMSDHSQGIK